jgi:DNA sulfur modification protein DndD
LKAIEDLFSDEGGEIFLKRNELEENLKEFKKQRANKEAELRELAAGPLPLLMLMDLLEEVEQFAIHESDVKKASLLLDILEARDDTVIRAIKSAELPAEAGEILSHLLEKDRSNRSKLANEPLIFNAEEGMASRIAHLRTNILPVVDKQSKVLIEEIASFDENILRLETELERVPTEERIVDIQSNLNRIRDAHRNKMSELESIRVRIVTLQRQRTMAESKLNKIGNSDIDARYAEDDRLRMLSHSPKIRETLGQFRTTVIQKHLSNIEGLMLESFKKLLRKSDLVKGLSINPANYEVTLLGRDHKILPFDRLSAGERQLLATSLLWGLARASGHPVPTVIDTPLGRLDSSHRKHLIERYFPNASHQVLLLSTDEEIVGPYYKALRPYISRTYLLSHDEAADKTSIEKGYFQA